MLLFTDGLTELKRDGKMLGVGGLADKFGALVDRGVSVTELVTSLLARADEGPPEDDMTLMAVRYCPTSTTS
jgi:serine phosphatase RsbU (regulator of sigma subunit)